MEIEFDSMADASPRLKKLAEYYLEWMSFIFSYCDKTHITTLYIETILKYSYEVLSLHSSLWN